MGPPHIPMILHNIAISHPTHMRKFALIHALRTAHILLKLSTHLDNLLQMRPVKPNLDVLLLPRPRASLLLRIKLRQRHNRVKGIPDLPSIPPQLLYIFMVKRIRHKPQIDCNIRPFILQFAETRVPDLLPLAVREVGVVQHHVDAGDERFVEGADAVCCQEEEALVVLERAEEDADQAVTLQVPGNAGLEVDVCFVKEEDCFPEGGELEPFHQVLFDFVGVDA